MIGTTVVLVLLVIFAGVFAKYSITIVLQPENWLVERFGKYHRTLQPGLNIVIPIMDKVAFKHHMSEYVMPATSQECITKDNVTTRIDGVLHFRIVDANLASYGANDYLSSIVSLAQTSLRAEVGDMTLDTLLASRKNLNKAVVEAMDLASSAWGVKVMRYEIQDIIPPEEVRIIMQKQMTAEREKRALITESEGTRQATINTAEGESTAISLVAAARAESLTKVGKATQKEGGLVAANLHIAEKYVDAFGNIAKEGNTIMLPGNASDIGSMVATAMAVVKNV